MQYIVFLIDEQQFGLHLSFVERVLSIVEVTRLPNAPEYLLGAIDLHGEIVPVINLRNLFGIKKKDIDLTDQLLLCKFRDRLIALWVDRVSRITTASAETKIENQVYSKMQGVKQAVEDNGKLIFILDIDQLVPFETLHPSNNDDR